MPKGEKKAGGRPRTIKNHSDRVKNNYLKAARKIAAETGMTVEEHYLRMSIDPKIQGSVRQGFAKLYNEALLIKTSEQTITDKRLAPTISLPPIMEQPKREEQQETRIH